jgi:nucleoside-diphosphate-sugar epimerase
MCNLKTVDAITSDRAYGIEKARNELGYFLAHALEDGLRETVE